MVSPDLAVETSLYQRISKRSHFQITGAGLSIYFIIYLFHECAPRLVLFRKHSFFILLQHLILLSLVQDGAICAEVLEKSKTIVPRLLRSGKLSGFSGNLKKKIKNTWNACLVWSDSVPHLSVLSISNLNTQNVRRSASQILTSCVDVQGWSPGGGGATLSWKMFYILFSLPASFCKIKTHVQGLLVNLSHFGSLSAWAESTQFVYSRVILMWSALFFS